MLTEMELARQTGFTPEFFYQIRAGKRKVSIKSAELLEIKTLIPKEAWSFPDKFFNPIYPELYQGPYPPNLDHLSGEALELAKQIISAFPDRPPTKEEFKEFKRKLRRRK